MLLPEKTLEKIILDSGIIDGSDFAKAKEESIRSGESIADVLIGGNMLTENYLTELLSEYLDVPEADPSKEKIDSKVLSRISESMAQKKQLIAFGEEKGFLKIAMQDPLDLETIEYVKITTGMPVKIYIAGKEKLKKAMKNYKRDIGKEFYDIIESNIEKAKTSQDDPAKIAQEIPIISIMDTILDYAAYGNASDIHFEIFANKVVVRFRIDGILHDITELPAIVHSALIARIKILSNLQIDEHRAPQDGRFKFRSQDRDISVRVSIMPTFHGEKAVLRILSGSLGPVSFAELGLSENCHESLYANIMKTQGMILVTGPTGSGKTTTLYSILHILNKQEVNICTIEDPIEYDIARINQTQVNKKTGITFADGLRSFLRQDPNIIMVGEIRDKETLNMAIQASLTGHLVLATLHTNSASLAIPRMIDMGAEPFLLASTLNLVIAQRLVRKNCTKCLSSGKIDAETLEIIKSQLSQNPHSKFNIGTFDTIYSANGCEICGKSGYRGRIGIFEFLNITSEIKKLILRKAQGSEIRDTAEKEGMVPMFEDGLEKVQKGLTTISEILRVIRE
ncbi:MAG: GspE/PulE family protein [Candidatus Paceibacterota bacterium]|jgi:type IV pilus assembly protein PilB